MQRRVFSREFKVEAVKLVRDRGVAVAQASRDLEVAESVLRRWMRDLAADPGQAFPGHGQIKPEQQEIDRLRREVAKLKAERDILIKAAVGSSGQRNGLGERSGWCFVAKGFSRPGVEPQGDRVEIFLAVHGQI